MSVDGCNIATMPFISKSCSLIQLDLYHVYHHFRSTLLVN